MREATMKKLLAGLLITVAAACATVPGSTVEVSWGPSPWYPYCTWDTPCWYSESQLFVYGWGYVDRPTYVTLYANPGRRDSWANRRRDWHPSSQPRHRGRNWDDHDRNGRNHDRDH